MNRPWHVWSLFALCLAVAASALAWLSVTVLRVDRVANQSAAQAAVEEDVRLALWRIDTSLATVVALENSRPFFAYSPFYSTDRPYAQMLGETQASAGLVASPLLSQRPPHMKLYFQIDDNGCFSSPQAPDEALRALAAESAPPDGELDFAATDALLTQLEGTLDSQQLRKSLPAVEAPPTIVLQPLPPTEPANNAEREPGQLDNLIAQQPQVARQGRVEQSRRNYNEYNQRSQSYQQLAVNNSVQASGDPLLGHNEVRVGLIQPSWLGTELLLARRVAVQGREYIQGCWVDWPALRQSLLESVADLLPGAALQPVAGVPSGNRERMLAAIPVQLMPGPAAAALTPGLTPIEWSLAVAWGCLGLAAVAVAALLSGVLGLSERRAAFVSAVTHELRTPLTTFRMYAEMLAGGMVPDEEKRRHYLETLRVEADRLSHLVENVLSYARLERGVSRSRLEPVGVGPLLDRVRNRLADRAAQVDMQLVVDAPESALAAHALADGGAVEQILFNLVDNACKYGAVESNDECRMTNDKEGLVERSDNPSEVARRGVIHLEAERLDRQIVFRVRDEGPGIGAAERKRLFRPFSKTAQQAAVSAPGVGLGLALCRRLARQLGGDLRFVKNGQRGATFELLLASAGS